MKQFFLIPLFQHKSETIKIHKDKFTIGRDSTCDCSVNFDSISRVHAIILFEENNFYIQDSDSSNGTFVNEIKIAEKTMLKEGYTIRLSNLVFEVSTNLPEKVLFFQGEYKVIVENVKNKDILVKYLLSEKKLVDNISAMLLIHNDIEKILSNILDFAINLLNADRGILLTKDNDNYIPKVSSNIGNEFSSVNTLSKSIVDYVVENKKPILVNNPVFNARFMGKSLLQFQIESSLCSPIYIGDEIAAILYVDNREEKKQFSTFQYALYLSFISHCQNILFNAKKNEKLLEDLLAQSVVSRWDEINRVKDKVVHQFTESIIKPLHVLTKEIDELGNDDETLRKFKETYKSVVNNIDELNIDVEIDKDMAILTSVNVKILIQEIIDEIQDYLDINKIKLSLLGSDISFKTYKLQLNQVIKNLILFLIKKLPSKGEIILEVTEKKSLISLRIKGCEPTPITDKNKYFSSSESGRMLDICSNLLRGMGGVVDKKIENNCFVFDIKISRENSKFSIGAEIENQKNADIIKPVVLLQLIDEKIQKTTERLLGKKGFVVVKDSNVENIELYIIEADEERFEKMSNNCNENCKVIAIVDSNVNEDLKNKLSKRSVFVVIEKPFSSEKILEVSKMIMKISNAQKETIRDMRTSIIRDLVATMKHEINNSLQIISMNIELVANDNNKERINKVRSGTNRIAEIIENLSNLNEFELVKYASSNRQIITPKKK